MMDIAAGACFRLVRAVLFAGFPLAALLGAAVAEPLSDGVNAYGRKDYATAKRILRPLAERGSSVAQFYLGLSYERGKSISESEAEAVTWFRKAAEQGLAAAQAALGTRYFIGWGGGISFVPVEINGTLRLDFALDSGASDVSIPADVFSTLKRTATVKEADFIGQQSYVLADGSTTQSATFKIRSLRIGELVIADVKASVTPSHASLLLGQSLLERFKSWSIDNTTHELLLELRESR